MLTRGLTFFPTPRQINPEYFHDFPTEIDLNPFHIKSTWRHPQHRDTALDAFKAETHDATNRCDTSPRQVAATNRLVWHVKIIVAATEFCRSDLSHKFKLVWIWATYRSDKLSASDLSQQQCRRGDLSPRRVASCVSAFRNKAHDEWLLLFTGSIGVGKYRKIVRVKK